MEDHERKGKETMLEKVVFRIGYVGLREIRMRRGRGSGRGTTASLTLLSNKSSLGFFEMKEFLDISGFCRLPGLFSVRISILSVHV